MAAIVYNKENSKLNFIFNSLLDDLLNKVSDSNLQIDRLARMKLFPFVLQDGTIKISSLVDENKPWFYLETAESQHTSRDSYRILADGVLSAELKGRLVKILGRDYLRPYNPGDILENVVSQMQAEHDYTSGWWQKAIEVYELWDGNTLNYDFLQNASSNIENDYFLFRASYCDPKYSKLLLDYKVFRDIRQHPLGTPYYAYAEKNPGKNPMTLLRLFGVPNSFITTENRCSQYLRRLFLGIRDHIFFPLSDLGENEQALCELSHYVVFNVIQNQNRGAFYNMLRNEEYHPGIVVRNRRHNYIPISYSLFYQPAPLNGQERRDITDDILESLHIDERVYETGNSVNTMGFWQSIGANAFDGSLQFAPNYRFGNLRVSDGQFYQWIWHYLQDVSTARLILGWLTNRRRIVTDERVRTLAMDAIRLVLSAPHQDSDRNFRFQIKYSINDAVRDMDRINSLAASPTLQNIHIIINDSVNRYDAIQLKTRITRAIVAKPAVIAQIQRDRIWENIYTTEALRNEKFFIAWSESESTVNLEDEQILVVSGESVEKCILKFIGQKHNIDVTKIDLSGKNYQMDFRNLIFDIRSFMSATREYTSTQPPDNTTIVLSDVANAEEEMKLWLVLKSSREAIWNSDKPSPNIDYNVFTLDNFLRRTYRGRCQICGSPIPRDVPEEQYEFLLGDKPGNTFSHALHNLLCLCPVCHSDLRMGYGRRDLSSVTRMAGQYINRMENVGNEFRSTNNSIISQFARRHRFSEGFSDPIVCEIFANGKEERLFFSWEHFIRFALVFYNPEKDYRYSGEIGELMELLRMLSV